MKTESGGDISWVTDKLRETQDSEFLIFKGQTFTYDDLLARISFFQKELEQNGIREGECVALIGDYSPNAIFLLMALLLNRNIVVPLSNESREKHLDMFEDAKVNQIIEINKNDSWTLREGSESASHPLLDDLRERRESGIIIFTSGTSGKSKASVLSAGRLLEKYKTAKRKPLRTLIFLKLDHIGGINTLFAILFNGGTIVTSDSRTPESVYQAVDKHAVQVLPATPTFLNMLLMSKADAGYNLSSLRLITYGTEPMPQSTLRGIHRLFPDVWLKQTYGLTELGIFSTKSKDSQSTWMKVGGAGTETKITGGTLWVRSESAMLGYLNAPSPFDEDGWYDTGDQVETDGEYIRILGRKSEIINVGGEKVFPAEVESVFLEIPNVRDVLITGRKNPITGEIVAAEAVLEKEEDIKSFRKRAVAHCKQKLQPYQIPQIISVTDRKLSNDRFKKIRNV
ncbi:long-chain fatty acid--CoA ligase [Bacillus velezensis]|uniref:long-chain fatty acid--CoA ligase n=1 Tax=Bacillus velezensis TaxID=492670 RepID=UPI0009B0DFAA|nr:fatty acid--CoA ligase family protein [Bacillus velezensis]MEC1107090.1 long-chain fatty acid--CoA ligase [Bacillus velezensis]OQC79699.1 AMP-dependent synthetase [Bacillus velezensis]RUR99801.1 Acetyl-coenzyme A synthetase [Bacillus velezensis]